MKTHSNANTSGPQKYVYSLPEEVNLIKFWRNQYDFWDFDENEILMYARDTLINSNNFPHTKYSIMPLIRFDWASSNPSHPAAEYHKELLQRIIDVLYCALYRTLCYGQHYNQQGVCRITDVKLVGDELHLFVLDAPGDRATPVCVGGGAGNHDAGRRHRV